MIDLTDAKPRSLGPGEKPPKVAKFGDPEHDKFVQRMWETNENYCNVLSSWYISLIDYWELFASERKDDRKTDEKWRSNIFIPRPFSSTETKVAQEVEMLLSADPWVQAEGIEYRDQDVAKMSEELIDYALRRNLFRRLLMTAFRGKSVQGVEFLRTIQADKAVQMWMYPTDKELEYFRSVLAEARQDERIGPSMPEFEYEPEAFEEWRKNVNDSGFMTIPEIPSGGKKTLRRYRGPVLSHVPALDCRFDPMIFDIADQNAFIVRHVVSKGWVEARTGKGDLPFDEKQVKAAIDSASETYLTEEEQRLANLTGIEPARESDPYYRNAVELHEVWRLQEDEYKYAVILNWKAVINKHPHDLPYMHGMNSITPIRNLTLFHAFHGMSDYKITKSMFEGINRQRNIRADLITLATLPVFTRLQTGGLSEVLGKIRPGDVIPISSQNQLQQLLNIRVPGEAFREPMELVDEVDFTIGTTGNLRGQSAPVGRVSATESQSRLTQASIRMKVGVMLVEEELQPIIQQILGLWYEFGDEKTRYKITGRGGGWKEVAKGDLIEAMNMDLRFRGATRMIGRDMSVQQLFTFFQTFGGSMGPGEIRELMRQVFETMGQKGVDEIVTEEFTKKLIAQVEAQQQAQSQGRQPGQGQPGQGGAPPEEDPAPDEISPEEAQAMGI